MVSPSQYSSKQMAHKLETDFMVESQGDSESIEGIDAFLEKREPNYKKLR